MNALRALIVDDDAAEMEVLRELAKQIDQLYPSIKVQLTSGYSERGRSAGISDGEGRRSEETV